ncbi:MAG: hypothetical protein ACOZQL_00120 [Myxococcota bacterium]
MRRAERLGLLFAVTLAASGVAWADAPVRTEPAPRSARLLGEAVTVAVGGVVLPVGAYLGLTAGLQSFVGFFAGFATATVLGVVVAPIAVIVVSRLLGASDGTGRAVVGALVGLALGVLLGLPLATLPSAAYVLGLGLLWALPSAGAMAGLEWGRRDEQPTGVTIARF